MSTLKIEILELTDVKPHPNADLLDLAIIKGWQTVIKKGSFKSGDQVVYIPIDCVLPVSLSDYLNVTNYLSKGRVRAVKLRGEPSYGFVVEVKTIENYLTLSSDVLITMKNEIDLKEILGITKYEPPIPVHMGGDAERPHEFFIKYTDIENLRNYPDVLVMGEPVRITEKIHGTNGRIGWIEDQFMYGSHNVRFKESEKNIYCNAWGEEVKNMIKLICTNHGNGPVIAFGEIFGSVQDLTYGHKNGKCSYAVFDIWVNGQFLDYEKIEGYCKWFGVPTVPLLYKGKWYPELLNKWKDTDSTFGHNMMEGVVITPLIERTNPKTGRVILKYVFDRYLNRKGGTEYH